MSGGSAIKERGFVWRVLRRAIEDTRTIGLQWILNLLAGLLGVLFVLLVSGPARAVMEGLGLMVALGGALILGTLFGFLWNLLLAPTRLLSEDLVNERRRSELAETKLDLAHQEIGAIRAARPAIRPPRIVSSGQETLLEIVNVGEVAEFEAEVSIVDASFMLPLLNLPGYWQGSGSKTTMIKHSLSDRLLLAIHEDALLGGINPSHRFAILSSDRGHEPLQSPWSPSYVPTVSNNIPSYAVIEVRLSTNPSMATGPVVRRYKLSNAFPRFSEIEPEGLT